MATTACQGFPSPLESQLVESRILRLRSPSSKPLTSQPIDLALKYCFWDSNTKTHCEEDSNKTDNIHNNPIPFNPGWSFFQALSNISEGPKEPLGIKEVTTYVHPQLKQSSLRLSPKSLELCTENLGNETGTDITESGIDLLSSSDCAGGNMGTREQNKSRQLLGGKKAHQTQNFPPPLTTIRGSESLRVRPHREDGRLVIEVTKVPSTASCFQAERSHGRLRLCFLKNLTTCFDPEDDDNEGLEEEFDSEMNGQRQDVEEEDAEEEDEDEEEGEEETEEEEDVEDGEGDACGCEETEGNNSWNSGFGDGMMRMEKYERERPSRGRCREGDHESNELLLNWGEPHWVATTS